MTEKEKLPARAGQALAPEQVANVSGGDGGSCSTTMTIGTGGIVVQSTYNSFGDALIGTYEGIVDATSYVIERVATATSAN